MKKIIAAVLVIVMSLITVPTFAMTNQENLNALKASWVEPEISFIEEENVIIIENIDWKEISEVIVEIGGASNFAAPQHYYESNNDMNGISINIPNNLTTGRHTLKLKYYDENHNICKDFLGDEIAYYFVVGESPNFADYGVKYDNFDVLKDVDEELYETAVNSVKEMFSKFPILINALDCITIKTSESDETFKEDSTCGGYTLQANTLTISDNTLRLATDTVINYELNYLTIDIANTICHELTHSIMFLLTAKYKLGVNTLECNRIESYYVSKEYSVHQYEAELRDSILIENGYSLDDIGTEIREYASSKDSEFFTNAVAEVMTNSNPSELSKIATTVLYNITNE